MAAIAIFNLRRWLVADLKARLSNSEIDTKTFLLAKKQKVDIGDKSMKMMSVIAITPKESSVDEITDLIVKSRAAGVHGLDNYSIVHTREDQLLVVNEWSSLDAFMDYVNGPHNMIELIEHLCIRLDEENVCKAYSGAIIHQEN